TTTIASNAKPLPSRRPVLLFLVSAPRRPRRRSPPASASSSPRPRRAAPARERRAGFSAAASARAGRRGSAGRARAGRAWAGFAAGVAVGAGAICACTSMTAPQALHFALSPLKESGSLYLAPQFWQTIWVIGPRRGWLGVSVRAAASVAPRRSTVRRLAGGLGGFFAEEVLVLEVAGLVPVLAPVVVRPPAVPLPEGRRAHLLVRGAARVVDR